MAMHLQYIVRNIQMDRNPQDAVSLGRWAPPWQLWHQLDKKLWNYYECVKITTFLLIYSCSLCAHHFLGPHDTLPCVLIVFQVRNSVRKNSAVKTENSLESHSMATM